MATGHQRILATLQRPGLAIPLGCTMLAQYMQDVLAAGHEAAALAQQSLQSPFFLFSFLKLLALTTLIVHAARLWVREADGGTGAGTSQADRYLALILGANIALGGMVLVAIRLAHSDALTALLGARIAPLAGKAALLCVVLAALAPLNRRVFHDISLAIGSRAHCAGAAAPSALNRRFVVSLTRPFVTYVAPGVAAHLLLARLVLGAAAPSPLLAGADALVVGALGVLAGYAISGAHAATLASASTPTADLKRG